MNGVSHHVHTVSAGKNQRSSAGNEDLLLSTCLKPRSRFWSYRSVMELHLANHVSAGARQSHLQLHKRKADRAIIWEQFSSLQRLNKHPRLPQPLRCQICLALKVILRHAWMLRLDPTMQVDSIETPQNETHHELPRVACLSPFLILLDRPTRCIRKDVWLKLSKLVLSGQKTTHLQKAWFSKNAHFSIGTYCMNYISPNRFYSRSLNRGRKIVCGSKKLTI